VLFRPKATKSNPKSKAHKSNPKIKVKAKRGKKKFKEFKPEALGKREFK